MVSSSRLHFIFPYRKLQERILSIDEFQPYEPAVRIMENETFILLFESNDDISVSLKTDHFYEVSPEKLNTMMGGHEVEFTKLQETKDGLLVLEPGRYYVLSSGGDNAVGFVPGSYFIDAVKKDGRKIGRCQFLIRTLSTVDSVSLDRLKVALERFSKGITVSKRLDYSSNPGGFQKDSINYDFPADKKDDYLRKVHLLYKELVYSLQKTHTRGITMKKQDGFTIRRNSVNQKNSFYNAGRAIVYDLPINRVLKHYLLLIKNLFFSLMKKTEGKDEHSFQMYLFCYQRTVKVLDDLFGEVMNIEGVFLIESFLSNPLYSFFKDFHEYLKNLEKNGNEGFGTALRYKDSSEIFELGGIVFLKNTLEELGYCLKEESLLDENTFSSGDCFYMENGERIIKILYDHLCRDFMDDQASDMISINSHNNRPDFIVELFDKTTGELVDSFVLEMKYRKLKSILIKAKFMLDDYIQLAYKPEDGRVRRAVVSKVFVFYPSYDELVKTDFSYSSMICGIKIEGFLKKSGASFESFKNEVSKIVN